MSELSPSLEPPMIESSSRSGAHAVMHRMPFGAEITAGGAGRISGRLIFATHPDIRATVTRDRLEPWSVTWLLSRRHARR